MKILLVENDGLTASLLAEALTAQQYEVSIMTTAEQVNVESVIAFDYDLILLTLLISNFNGIDFCRQLRGRDYHKPILLITSGNSSAEVSAGLEAGADDYIAQPYNLAELMARIRALLRRSRLTAPTPTLRVLSHGSLLLNLETATLRYQHAVVALTPPEVDLIALLLESPQQAFSRAQLVERLSTPEHRLSRRAIAELIRRLRHKFRQSGIEAGPIETVYGSGYRLHSSIAQSPPIWPIPPNRLAPSLGLNRVLERFRGSFQEQVVNLERVYHQLLEQGLQAELRRTGEQEAHKLAGGLGIFGYLTASDIAREIEWILSDPNRSNKSLIQDLAAQLAALKQALTYPPAIAVPEALVPSQIPSVLVVDDDVALTETLKQDAIAWGVDLEVAHDLGSARQQIMQSAPDVILLDLIFPDTDEDGLELLQELREQFSDIPVLTMTIRDRLADRVTTARLGSRGFLSKPIPSAQVFEEVMKTLFQRQATSNKVIIVDSDPAMLSNISIFLSSHNFQVIALGNPNDFWHVLTATAPDLLLLNAQMPTFSGLDLCQVVRQDPHWGDLPIVVMTPDANQRTIEMAFMAGADDFISKPIEPSDLLRRTVGRVERSRLQKQIKRRKQQEHQALYHLATIDTLTQVANRRRLNEYLKHEWQRLRREQAPLSLILCDIDYFKNYNDHYGHPAGDVCLQQIAQTIRTLVNRPADLVARYGGEEFCLVLPKTPLAGAVHIVNQIQQAIALLRIAHNPSPISDFVTLSFGITTLVPATENSVEQLIAAADQALYEAKAQGRNTYCTVLL
ncbi:response regulator [Almyronema epifaneia]|uniref:Response regulator n=1 Tax=Almyronema epifaneia S1 TaxID=2991925 RepID=A0ABW6IGG2_9CYAN